MLAWRAGRVPAQPGGSRATLAGVEERACARSSDLSVFLWKVKQSTSSLFRLRRSHRRCRPDGRKRHAPRDMDCSRLLCAIRTQENARGLDVEHAWRAAGLVRATRAVRGDEVPTICRSVRFRDEWHRRGDRRRRRLPALSRLRKADQPRDVVRRRAADAGARPRTEAKPKLLSSTSRRSPGSAHRKDISARCRAACGGVSILCRANARAALQVPSDYGYVSRPGSSRCTARRRNSRRRSKSCGKLPRDHVPIRYGLAEGYRRPHLYNLPSVPVPFPEPDPGQSLLAPAGSISAPVDRVSPAPEHRRRLAILFRNRGGKVESRKQRQSGLSLAWRGRRALPATHASRTPTTLACSMEEAASPSARSDGRALGVAPLSRARSTVALPCCRSADLPSLRSRVSRRSDGALALPARAIDGVAAGEPRPSSGAQHGLVAADVRPLVRVSITVIVGRTPARAGSRLLWLNMSTSMRAARTVRRAAGGRPRLQNRRPPAPRAR